MHLSGASPSVPTLWPRTLGIGLCFEEAPLRPELTAALEAVRSMVLNQ